MRKSLSDFVVEAHALTKRFGKVTALDGLDLFVERGEVHGFLGPNGAGKSTTIRALLGQIRLDAGHVSVLGMDAWERAVDIHERLSYVPGDTALWPGLTGGQCIDLLGGVHGSMNRRRRDELVERFELDPSRRFRTYSKGNRQKIALIAALACDVEFIILDEPTSGLDPLMESVFQQVLAERAAQGASALLSSHILAEVEALCARLTVVRSGRAVFTGPLEELRDGTFTVIDAVTAGEPVGLERMSGLSGIELRSHARGSHLTVQASAEALPSALATVAAARPLQLSVRPPSLEQLFLQKYAGAAETTEGGGRR